jgi:membrane protein YqaA with SNARE-associated domain
MTGPIFDNSFFTNYGLIGLFVNGMLSSIIPIPTELTVSGLLLTGQSKVIVFTVLTVGSIIGGFMAYYIGYSGNKFLKRMHKVPKNEHRYTGLSLLEKYGWAIIFFSPWIPILGDVLPIIAGAKRYNFKIFGVAIICGKVLKALAIVFFSGWILPFIFS